MNIFPDCKLISKFMSSDPEDRDNLLKKCVQAANISESQQLNFNLDWPALLEYLGHAGLFDFIPKYNEENKVFSSLIEVLKLDSEKEVIVYLFDQIFVECLREIKNLQQIYPKELVNQIESKLANPLFAEKRDPFALSLASYGKKFLENSAETMHDLILYLAWDRVCVYMAAIFDNTSLKIQNGLEILKECLVESFHHITKDGKTKPGFFRLVEALYAYQMKDEKIQSYSESEWNTLCQSVTALQSRDSITDACYIDINSPATFLIHESPKKVEARQLLANYMNKQLEEEFPDWTYALHPQEIVYI